MKKCLICSSGGILYVENKNIPHYQKRWIINNKLKHHSFPPGTVNMIFSTDYPISIGDSNQKVFIINLQSNYCFNCGRKLRVPRINEINIDFNKIDYDFNRAWKLTERLNED